MEPAEETQTFTEKPFAVVPFAVGVVAVVVIAVAVAVSIGGRGARLQESGLVALLVGVGAFIVGLLSLALSLRKRRQVICGKDSVELRAFDYWGNEAPAVRFGWRELADTDLRLVRSGRNARELRLVASLGGGERTLFARSVFNRAAFDGLLAVVNARTPHLGCELVKRGAVAGREVVATARGYAKVRRVPPA